jgi:hypothetical protein
MFRTVCDEKHEIDNKPGKYLLTGDQVQKKFQAYILVKIHKGMYSLPQVAKEHLIKHPHQVWVLPNIPHKPAVPT